MKLSEELAWRGFVYQTTYRDLSELDGEPIAFYWGVDPSADSMTIGNLAAAMMVRHFIDSGHKAYLLIGGATGMIGDPDGKKDERSLKALDEVAHNKQAISRQYQRIFSDKEFEIVDNFDWFSVINYISFLRDVGKYVPMGQMLGREFVQSRLGDGGSGISYAEFSYTLIQGYDFLHLFREHGVTLQVCGADQWGNSIAGVDLIRRIEGAEAHVYSVPLVVNQATGKKFGKTEEGAVWLDEDKTSVYRFYQFWLNLDDEGVIDYTKIYTLLNQEEIEAIAENHQANPAARLAQRTLAREVTDLVHGQERRRAVEKVTAVLFGEKDVRDLNDSELAMLGNEIPSLSAGISLVEALVEAGMAASNSDARRLIAAGAILVNRERVAEDSMLTGSPSLVKKGKNSFVLVR